MVATLVTDLDCILKSLPKLILWKTNFKQLLIINWILITANNSKVIRQLLVTHMYPSGKNNFGLRICYKIQIIFHMIFAVALYVILGFRSNLHSTYD